MVDRDSPNETALWCRNGYFGTISRPSEGAVELALECRCSGCKRGGVRATHIFEVTATASAKKVRPVRTVYRDPAYPGEVLG